MIRCNLVYIFISLVLVCYGQSSNTSLLYLGRTPPADQPEIFAPGFISSATHTEFGSVFSANGKEFYFGYEIDGRAEIRYSHLIDSLWSDPVAIVSHEKYGHNDPFLSNDEKQLYFISDRPLSGDGEKKDYDIWFVNRKENGWSKPINAGPGINTNGNEYYISFSQNDDLYFSSNIAAEAENRRNYDIYKSTPINLKYSRSTRLTNQINTPHYEADVFIAPDESYIIYCAVQKGGLGQGDLYVNFKNEDGTWSDPKNMAGINTEEHELCPFVSKDNQYFFFTRAGDIYWVDAKIIEQFRTSN